MTTQKLGICLRRTLAGLVAMLPLLAPAQTQGVSKSEIVVGSIQDLSGPMAPFGKDQVNGMRLRIAEINEQGGVHGRKLNLLVEDSGYDPRKSVLAAQKLVNQDKVFVMVGSIGTVTNLAAMPIQFAKNVMNFMPTANAREMYEPIHRLKWAFGPSYYESTRQTVGPLYREKKASRACILHQDDEYGLEVLRGAEAGLKEVGAELVERTTYKRGATEFSSQVARLKQADCDFVVLGTIIRETVGAIGEMRKIGYSPTLIGSMASYTHLIPRLGGKAMDGFHAAVFANHPYLDDASPAIRFWARTYQTAFGSDPSVLSVYGYAIVDRLVMALEKAGPQLSTEGLVRTMESFTVDEDFFGIPAMRYSADRHLGTNAVKLSQIKDARWEPARTVGLPAAR